MVVRAVQMYRAVGAQATPALLKRSEARVVAFCHNEIHGAAALGYCSREDDRSGVPDDVALIGFDELEEGRYSSSRPSTVASADARYSSPQLHACPVRIEGCAGWNRSRNALCNEKLESVNANVHSDLTNGLSGEVRWELNGASSYSASHARKGPRDLVNPGTTPDLLM